MDHVAAGPFVTLSKSIRATTTMNPDRTMESQCFTLDGKYVNCHNDVSSETQQVLNKP